MPPSNPSASLRELEVRLATAGLALREPPLVLEPHPPRYAVPDDVRLVTDKGIEWLAWDVAQTRQSPLRGASLPGFIRLATGPRTLL